MKKTIQTPIARARGLGASHTGVEGWISLRVTAIAQAILFVWFAYFLSLTVHVTHAQFIAILAQPVHAIAAILFVITGFHHAALGAREIVEDYIHVEWMKIGKLIAIKMFCFAAAAACIFSILKIAFATGL